MYWLVYSFCLLPLTYINKKNEEIKITYLFSLILTVFLVLRFGTGVDYFNYFEVYNSYKYKFLLFYTEPIFGFICYLFNKLHLSFLFFMGFIGFCSSYLILDTIIKFSKKKNLTLFLFFTLYYSVYFESAIRAGCAISIFIYAYFNFLRNRKVLKFYLAILFAMGFHYSSVFLFFIPLVRNLKLKYFLSIKYYILFSVLFLVCSFVITKVLVIIILAVVPKYAYYLNNKFFSRSYITLLLCLIKGFGLILLVPKERFMNKKLALDIKVYITGIYVYILLSNFSITSRITDFFMFMEIFIFPFYLEDKSINSKIIMLFLELFAVLMLMKDISSFLVNGSYFASSIIDYPYVSIFNKQSIFDFRTTNVRITDLLE